MNQMISSSDYRGPSSQTSSPNQYGHPAQSYVEHEQQRQPQPTMPQFPPPPGPPPQAQPQSQAPPSPTRKSMFEFVSPFDALAASQTGSTGGHPSVSKKKPAPPVPPSLISSTTPSLVSGSAASSGTEDASSAPEAAIPPAKRQSLDSIVQELSKMDQHKATQAQEASTGVMRAQAQPPKGGQGNSYSPPRRSPHETTQRVPIPIYSGPFAIPAAGAAESPVPPGSDPNGSGSPTYNNNAGRDASPALHGATIGNVAGGAQVQPTTGSSYSPSSPQSQQSIVFDVSQPQESTMAPRDSVKSTAIALLKIDPVFIHGCTIGVTTWVAYAMTKGRVRVIGRASGERTLLQLPNAFPPTTTVVDMVVSGNHLAAVTSDGGFVVWEVPRIIEDDVGAKLLLCVVPPPEPSALKTVKWHPSLTDTLAVASESEIYLVNVQDAVRLFGGEPVAQTDLARVGQRFDMVEPTISFAFDMQQQAIAAISDDSTLTLYSMENRGVLWSDKIPGEGVPSSIDFIDGGVIIGRKNGTIFQLLSTQTKEVLSSIKFVNGNREDPEMFGHIAYDNRIKTLWVANSKRDSLLAVRVCFDPPSPGGKDDYGYFEQLVEFPGLKPTIHLVILTADADPTGEEAEAACHAAKLPPGELALVAYSVHAHGVDQILIRKEWFDSALVNTTSKFPRLPSVTSQSPYGPSSHRMLPAGAGPAATILQPTPTYPLQPPSFRGLGVRARTPPSDEFDDQARDQPGVASGSKQIPESKAPKGFKAPKSQDPSPKDNNGKDKDVKSAKAGLEPILNDNPLGQALAREIRRSEESLQSRISRLITKELEKQHLRLEEVRIQEQAQDVQRQEKILKLISTELTKNTTRVVEVAVKNVITSQVLPALETITRNEVKSALHGQIIKGVNESINQALPSEIEKLLGRPDVSSHVARSFAASVTPSIERHIKESITKTIIPAYMQQSEEMHQDLTREIHAEMLNLKKEVITWQSEALKGQETMIREMEQAVRLLSEQVKYLSMNMSSNSASTVSLPSPPTHHRSSPVPGNGVHNPNIQSHLRQGSLPYPPQPSYAPPPTQWFNQPQLAPQHSVPNVPVIPPPAPQPVSSTTQDWDETYLAVLSSSDSRQLRELLMRSNPDVIMPLNGPTPLSQAVLLTLTHRIAGAVGEVSPADEFFKSGLWWLQRAASVVNANDPLISPYVGRVLPAVQQMLSTSRQRLAIIPNGPSLIETNRQIAEIQEIINRKVAGTQA